MKKDILLVVLVIAFIVLLGVVLFVSEKANKVNKSLDEERYSRMVAEESLQKNAAKLSTLEAQLRLANQKMTNVQDLIDQQKSTNGDLQRQYGELLQAKADLEEKVRFLVEEKAAAPEPQPVAVSP
jgi:peptidoglycan hydrolase CwlO-like protein